MVMPEQDHLTKYDVLDVCLSDLDVFSAEVDYRETSAGLLAIQDVRTYDATGFPGGVFGGSEKERLEDTLFETLLQHSELGLTQEIGTMLVCRLRSGVIEVTF